MASIQDVLHLGAGQPWKLITRWISCIFMFAKTFIWYVWSDLSLSPSQSECLHIMISLPHIIVQCESSLLFSQNSSQLPKHVALSENDAYRNPKRENYD
jgi:hypothetical protein